MSDEVLISPEIQRAIAMLLMRKAGVKFELAHLLAEDIVSIIRLSQEGPR